MNHLMAECAENIFRMTVITEDDNRLCFGLVISGLYEESVLGFPIKFDFWIWINIKSVFSHELGDWFEIFLEVEVANLRFVNCVEIFIISALSANLIFVCFGFGSFCNSRCGVNPPSSIVIIVSITIIHRHIFENIIEINSKKFFQLFLC